MTKGDLIIFKKVLREIDYLEGVLGEIKTREKFIGNETVRRAVAMTLINIGELARNVNMETRKSINHIPFRKIIGMRDVAAHGYLRLDFEAIWITITQDVPQLKEQLQDILSVT